ncbi:serine/threonine-protein kinase [Paludibacterium paludis]|uniref:serine/threonine-protein kinase n=2 Tax=Paludibacterium paludis TaxID=1225769 RepID=UPI001E5A3BC1|nr:serine/threonine-protein kinase [Paludibacterium paludis]
MFRRFLDRIAGVRGTVNGAISDPPDLSQAVLLNPTTVHGIMSGENSEARPVADISPDKPMEQVFSEFTAKARQEGRLDGMQDKLATMVRRHLASKRAQEPNEFGYRRFVAPERIKGRFGKPRLSHTFYLPAQGGRPYCYEGDPAPEGRALAKGGFKEVMARSPRHVAFRPVKSQMPFAKPAIDPAEYADLKTIVPNHVVDRDVMIASNAGTMLRATIRRDPAKQDDARFTAFRPLLADLAKLHDRGVFHLDIKPENLAVRTDASGRVVSVSLIDTDGMVKAGRALGNISYTSGYLPFLLKFDVARGDVRACRTADEFAMLFSLMESDACRFPGLEPFLREVRLDAAGRSVFPDYSCRALRNWMKTRIKPEYHTLVRDLLHFPYLHRVGCNEPPALVDMIRWPASTGAV